MESVAIKSIKRTKEDILVQGMENPMQMIQQLGGLSLYEFLQVFWELVTSDPLKLNWHIEFLCDEVQMVIERVAEGKPKEYDLIINIPPGTTKTIICLIIAPAWAWTKWYWMQFITASHSMPIALKSAVKCRDLVRSEKYQMMYPEIGIKEDEDSKSDFRVIKREWVYNGRVPRILHGGGRFTTSTDSSPTGTHGHVIFADDILNPKKAASPVELENANEFMDATMSTRKIDKEVTPFILIMQRLHQDDPTGHLLNKTGKRIKHICLPGELNGYEKFVKPQSLIKNYRNGLLDPVRLNREILMEMEADLGQYGYAGQVGQNPTPPGGGMFHVDHFQIIQTMPPLVTIINTIRYWDKAGTHKGGCYTVGVKMTRLANKKYLVQDVKRGQWSTEERERIIRKTAEADGSEVEQYFEQEGGSGGKESAEATVRNLDGFSASADSPRGDKVSRADPYSVQVNWGNVQLLLGEWNHDYIEEFRFFPFGKYKDQVDASSGGHKKLSDKKQAGVF